MGINTAEKFDIRLNEQVLKLLYWRMSQRRFLDSSYDTVDLTRTFQTLICQKLTLVRRIDIGNFTH